MKRGKRIRVKQSVLAEKVPAAVCSAALQVTQREAHTIYAGKNSSTKPFFCGERVVAVAVGSTGKDKCRLNIELRRNRKG